MASIDQTLINLAVATLLGAGIGFERQWRQRMAGLRTKRWSRSALPVS